MSNELESDGAMVMNLDSRKVLESKVLVTMRPRPSRAPSSTNTSYGTAVL